MFAFAGVSGLPFATKRPLVTLDLRQGFARVVVFQAGHVLAWGKAALPGNSTLQSAGPDATAGPWDEHVRRLLLDLTPRNSAAVLALPSSTCLMRQVQLPKVQRKYLRRVALSEVMASAPLAAEDVDVAWQRRPAGTRYQILATVAPKSAIDRHATLSRKLGLRLRAAYPRQVALALASGLRNGVIVEAQDGVAEIILLQDGFPLLTHREERGTAQTNQAWLSAVVMAVQELASNAEGSADAQQSERLPVALAEDTPPDDSLARPLAELTGRQVIPFSTSFRHPGHFPPQEYAANLGLALAYRPTGYPSVGRRPVLMTPALDLLPTRHRPKPFPWPEVGSSVALLLASYFALPVSSQAHAISQRNVQLTTAVASLETRSRQQHLAAASADVARRRTDEGAAYRAALETRLSGLAKDAETIQDRLKGITDSAGVTGVVLATVNTEAGGYVISGVSPDSDALLRFTDTLRASGAFTSVRVAQLQALAVGLDGSNPITNNLEGVSFRVKAEVAPLSSSAGAQSGKGQSGLLKVTTPLVAPGIPPG